jgi:[ribosomal protein S5]-alanine N-acetyltransferase
MVIPVPPPNSRIRFVGVSMTRARDLQNHLKDIRVTRYTYIPHPYTLAHAAAFIRRAQRERRNGQAIIFLIEELATGRLIGAIGCMKIDWPNKKAEFGYWFARDKWGLGFATEATRIFTRYAFETLRIERLYAKVFSPNPASMQVLEKCGFRHEGTLIRNQLHRGEWVDDHLYAMLGTEYRARTRGK